LNAPRVLQEDQVFGHAHWGWIRACNILNTLNMILCAGIFVTLSNQSRVSNAAIAEYILFFSIIMDTSFQLMDVHNNALI
jgi:predicted membrane protein